MAEYDEEENLVDEGTTSSLTSGAWSWNVALAAQRLSEAEDAFRVLVQDSNSGSVYAALTPINEEDEVATNDDDIGNNGREEVFQENETSARATADTTKMSLNTKSKSKTNGSKENMYTPPRKNRFIAPDKRPRHTRTQYRLSPLEPTDDEKLIPSMKMEDVASAIPAAIQRERLFEQHLLPLLLRKRVWCYDKLDYGEEHPMGGYGGGPEDVTPDDWAEDGVDDTGDDNDGSDNTNDGDDSSSNNEGMKKTNKPWPRGTPYDASVFTLCWNYFLFTYGKATAASNKVIIWEIIASFVPPACSYLFGTGLIDELNNQTSGGVTEQDRILRSSLYALAILSLRTIGSYLTTQPNNCGFSVNGVPTGLARAGLRDTLFHRMRHLKSTLNDKITPGGASGIIVDKAFETVNIYYAFLTFPALVSGILAEFAVSFTTLRNVEFNGTVILPMVAVIAFSLLLPVLINMWYQPELCILTRLEHQWRLRLRAIAGCAVPVLSEHFTPKSNAMNDTDDESGVEGEEKCFRKIFHQTVYLENMRHFHAWKFSVVITFLIEVFTQSGIAIVTIVAAYAVITGRGITVGNFSTLISSVSGVIKLGQAMGNFYISLFENHTMLKQISCIINDEDIGFDGGVDSFGSIHTGILEKEKQVASKFKHALHTTNHHHREHRTDPQLTTSDMY